MLSSRRFLKFALLFVPVLFPAVLQATIYPLDVFTNTGGYYNSPDLDLYVEVTSAVPGQVDFTFHNDSLIDSCIARIYFEDILYLGDASIINGPGTSFSEPSSPGNLPAGKTLGPAFTAARGFGSDPARPKNGVNPSEPLQPDEWVQISFDLIGGGTFGDVIGGLNAGTFRIGAHIIALPDESSESAVTVPEPATIVLLGLGGLLLRRRRNR